MPVALHCRYRPGGAEERLVIRDVHLKYMITHQALVQAGGAVVVEGRVIGMYLLLATEDDARVDQFLEAEPYCSAGLFEHIERLCVQQFMPEPHAGFLDELLRESRGVAERLRPR
jgi:uncharacterized protein